MHARSALFDLYGDHLRARADRAPVAALVRLMRSLDIAAPAVRTAISRMVRQAWLEPVRLPSGRGYALTGRARQHLDDAAARIYRTRDPQWHGAWDLLVVDPPVQRSNRERVRSGLSFLGYAPLSDSTWIAAFPAGAVEDLLGGQGAGYARFRSHDDQPAERARQAWDLDTLADDYRAWRRLADRLLRDPESELHGISRASEDEQAFAVRSVLLHEWRKFLFTDPGLPAELLPADWVGHEAARFFDREAERLLPAASRFVDDCLQDPEDTATRSTDPAPDQSGAHR